MKLNFTLVLSFIFISAASTNKAAAQATNVQDSLALVDLYNSTNGSNWFANQNWLTAQPVSTWVGVTVTNTRVTKIRLSNLNLTGFLPPSIGNLTALTSVDFSFNSLSDTIPASIGNWVQLQELYFEANQFTGSIPSSIGNLTNLTQLLLNGNQLTGSIPSSIGNLIHLQTISFYADQLTGSIPPSIGNLTKLTDLYLDYNHLSDTIPASFGNLHHLVYCYLQNNNLSGKLPSSMGNLSRLYTLQAEHNQLSGEIPESFFKLKNISGINLSFNHLTQSPRASYPPIHRRPLYFNLSANEFTFDGLEFAEKEFTDVQYYIEKNLVVHQNGNILSVYAGGTLSNNTYTWYNHSGNIVATIVGDSTFQPAASGVYHVVVANAVANLTTISSDEYNYVQSLAAKNAMTAYHLLVYPNPASSIIHIRTGKACNIAVTDAGGKLLFIKKISGTAAVSVATLPNGVYYISNTTTGEKQKFVVVR